MRISIQYRYAEEYKSASSVSYEGEKMTNAEKPMVSRSDRLFYQKEDRAIKAAIYCRLSEEDRNKTNKSDDSNSIRNQKSMLMEYAYNQNWEIYDIYSDDDYAGADRNRPQFKRMLADAEAHMFDIILCKTQSRFTRELELVEKYIHGLFPVWGIRFVSIVDNADTENKGNKKSRQINGLVNEWYLEDMSENIRSVLTSRRVHGFHIGAFAPYGYKKDPKLKGHLIIDEEAAQVVREIFLLFADGYGKTAIAKKLNDRGIPNPTEYKRLKGFRYSQSSKSANPLWKYHSIQWILSNEAYIGNLVQGKMESISYKTRELKWKPKDQWIKAERTHEPIIEMDLWEKVQNKISSHARTCSRTGKVHLFSGAAFCIHCGYALRVHKGKANHYYLQCETKYISRSACPGAFIPESELERIIVQVLRTFNQRFLDIEMMERLVNLESALTSKKQRCIAEIIRIRHKVDECNGAVKQLYADKTSGIITIKDYLELSAQFQADKARYEKMIQHCEEQIHQIEVNLSRGDNRTYILESYVQLDNLTRGIVESLINRIEVGKRNRETGIVPVKIIWKF